MDEAELHAFRGRRHSLLTAMSINPIVMIFGEDRAPQFLWIVPELHSLLGEMIRQRRMTVKYADELMEHAAMLQMPENIGELLTRIIAAANRLGDCEFLQITEDKDGRWITWQNYKLFQVTTVLETYRHLQEMVSSGQLEKAMAIPVLAKVVMARVAWDDKTPSPIVEGMRFDRVPQPKPNGDTATPATKAASAPADQSANPEGATPPDGERTDTPPTPPPAPARTLSPADNRTGSAQRAPVPPTKAASLQSAASATGTHPAARPTQQTTAATPAAASSPTVQMARPGTPPEAVRPPAVTAVQTTPAPGQRARAMLDVGSQLSEPPVGAPLPNLEPLDGRPAPGTSPIPGTTDLPHHPGLFAAVGDDAGSAPSR